MTNEQAFLEYQDKIFNYLYRATRHKETAEDLTQETFLKVCKNWDSYDQSRPFNPWIYRIAHNELASYCQVNSKKLHDPLDDCDYSDDTNLHDMFCLKDQYYRVKNAITALDSKSQAIISARYIEDKTYIEIAKEQKTTPNNVGILLTRAKRKLRTNM